MRFSIRRARRPAAAGVAGPPWTRQNRADFLTGGQAKMGLAMDVRMKSGSASGSGGQVKEATGFAGHKDLKAHACKTPARECGVSGLCFGATTTFPAKCPWG